MMSSKRISRSPKVCKKLASWTGDSLDADQAIPKKRPQKIIEKSPRNNFAAPSHNTPSWQCPLYTLLCCKTRRQTWVEAGCSFLRCPGRPLVLRGAPSDREHHWTPTRDKQHAATAVDDR